MPGRKYDAGSGYRYGFNGKEKDNSTGEGNLDFGARISDSRLGGRFLSIDPLAKKYPSLSPYLYALNNPIVLVDRNGEDAIVSITRNKDGSGGTILYTVNVYMTGKDVNQKYVESTIKGHNSAAKNIYKNRSVNIEGKVWNVKFEVKYVYQETFDNKKLKPGENVLESNEQVAKSSSAGRTHVSNPNNYGYMKRSDWQTSDVVTHETGHLIGFSDKYIEIGPNNAGFREYLTNTYGNKPGGEAYEILNWLRENKDARISVPSPGQEDNHMADQRKNGLSDDQYKALVMYTLNQLGDKNTGTITGMVDEDTKNDNRGDALKEQYDKLIKMYKDATKPKEDVKKTP